MNSWKYESYFHLFKSYMQVYSTDTSSRFSSGCNSPNSDNCYIIGNKSTLNSWPEIIDRHVCNLPYTIISDFTFSFKLYLITGNLLAIYKGLKNC